MEHGVQCTDYDIYCLTTYNHRREPRRAELRLIEEDGLNEAGRGGVRIDVGGRAAILDVASLLLEGTTRNADGGTCTIRKMERERERCDESMLLANSCVRW